MSFSESRCTFPRHALEPYPASVERADNIDRTGISQTLEHRMHKFAVGQVVYFESTVRCLPGTHGTYQVTRLMPVDTDDQLRYRIKSAGESFERVVTENQLASSP
jgi:hypothetical protein